MCGDEADRTGPDPYTLEIFGREVIRHLCRRCYRIRLEEI